MLDQIRGNSKEIYRRREEQSIEILGVAKFVNLQILQVANFCNLQILQVANFCSLRTLLTCVSLVPVDCFFSHLFGGFIRVFPYVNLVLLNIIVISYSEHLYKLSHACNQINLFIQLISQSGWHESSSPLLLVIFSSSCFTFLHFLVSQTPLDDDKSRDARLKPPDP